MVFNLILHHIAGTAVYLFGDVIAEFGTCESLLLPFGIHKVCRLYLDNGISLGAACNVLAESREIPLSR